MEKKEISVKVFEVEFPYCYLRIKLEQFSHYEFPERRKINAIIIIYGNYGMYIAFRIKCKRMGH